MNDMKTAVENMVAQFGSNNIFLIKEDYHGLYEDDDCEFEYYNNVTGEAFGDGWTTRCACPSYNRYMATHIRTALREGLVDVAKFMDFVRNRFYITGENLKLNVEDVAYYGLRVEVSKGRKWKGTGYLIGLEESSYQYYTPQFAARPGYGESTTVTAKIYDPLTGKIERATAKYVKFLDEEKIISAYVEKYNSLVDDLTVDQLKFEKCNGILPERKILSLLEYVKQNAIDTTDMVNGYDEVAIERQRKAQEYREKQMKNIMAWVLEHTDKTGADALELAERIFKKRCA